LTKGGDILQENAQRHYFNNKNPALHEAFGPRLFADPKYPNANDTINTTLKKLNAPKFDLPTNLAIRAAFSYLNDCSPDGVNFNDIIDKLKSSREDWFTVRSIDEATQGDNTGIIKGMNNNSSSGMFYGGDKTSLGF
jgi:hypothetical protein